MHFAFALWTRVTVDTLKMLPKSVVRYPSRVTVLDRHDELLLSCRNDDP